MTKEEGEAQMPDENWPYDYENEEDRKLEAWEWCILLIMFGALVIIGIAVFR